MYLNTFLNALSLCLLNISFLVVGTFLNSVVIISLWRSSQLRKKLCYFMILVLSCFDLAVVTITHPITVLSTILWSKQMYEEKIDFTRMNTSILLSGFSIFALLTLNNRTFPGLNLSIFSSNNSHKRKTYILYGFTDDHASRFVGVLPF